MIKLNELVNRWKRKQRERCRWLKKRVPNRAYLEDFGEETGADLLAKKVVEPVQVGHGVAKRLARRHGPRSPTDAGAHLERRRCP